MAKEKNDIPENIDKFVYLGSTISHNGDLTPELNNCIDKTASAFNRIMLVMSHNGMFLCTFYGM